jgi:FkbM family methyltransferase
MRLGRRRLRAVRRKLLDGSNYRAIPRFFEVHHRPFRVMIDDVFSRGAYPRTLGIKTPTGPLTARLYSAADLSTLNLVFCRQDYLAPRGMKVAVDVGSNIGLSSLFWLTRGPDTFVYCFEPSPVSYERLVGNLAPFTGRFDARCAAVSNFKGTARLGIESSGVNSSLERQSDVSVECEVLHINDILERALTRYGQIDVLKIDSEGHEARTLESIPAEHWARIRCVNIGCHGASDSIPRTVHRSMVASAELFWR